MRKVHLHGALARHGKSFDLDVMTAGEAVCALGANFPSIIEDLRIGSWILMRGDPDTGMALNEEAIMTMRLGDADLHIMPEIMGAKNGGILKAVVGVALIAASFGGAAFLAAPISGTLFGATTWGNAIGSIGLAMTLSGVSTMLAPETDTDDGEDNYTITGPTGATGQGQAVQIIYGGPIMSGGMLISGGISAPGLEQFVEEAVTVEDTAAIVNEIEGP